MLDLLVVTMSQEFFFFLFYINYMEILFFLRTSNEKKNYMLWIIFENEYFYVHSEEIPN